MAKVVHDPKVLPDQPARVAQAKPPVKSFPYKDSGHPEEADAFRLLIRRLRRQPPATQRTDK